MPRSDFQPRFTSPTSVALDNLRAAVIVIVLVFHSVLAYVAWAPAAAGFDSPPYDWRSFPIVDDRRFFGFDLFCAWQDVYLMALMFLLSGLFVWPSLVRKKDWAFLRDRVLRLGLPFGFGIAVLMPLAIYPVYPGERGRPEPGGLLASLARAAVLAERAAVVHLAAFGA